ncbi:ABC transporter permease [Actinopolymorpha rutila]|uniref:Transport permease protein n=1 Tax=Actinopolymorpha rutila TaxID=446787 RepID=A0A852ZW04_9ACTN|nr:ABC transporter permease [Actinopolymorpha rutila]NYH92876.1 lipooligosaccharide transport system permease protein [Actinopolymorpha rutila]
MTTLASRTSLPTYRSLRVAERKYVIYRREWWAMLLGTFQPVLYLAGIGLGVGTLVGTIDFGDQQVSYLAYVAPGLMAAAAMNGSLDEVISSLLWDLRQTKIHDVTLSTPIQPVDLAAGEVLAAVLRATTYSASFLAISWILGAVPSLWGLLAVPAATFVGAVFACVGCAITTYLRTHADIGTVEVVLLPILLFSATLFPPSAYPAPLHVLAEISPLTRGADLLRCLTTGELHWTIAADIAYLLGIATTSFTIAVHRLDRQLRH